MRTPTRSVCLALFLFLALTAGLTATAQTPSALPWPDLPLQGRIQVGEEVPMVFETPHPYGTGIERMRAERVLQHKLHFPGASYVAPHFSRFELAAGDYVIVRSPDGSRSWRFEGYGKGDLGKSEGFWGIHVAGDTAIVELFSRGSGKAFGYAIDRIARGFTREELGLPQTEALCGPDNSDEAKCYQTTEPDVYDRSRTVARLLIQGTSLCTGWLVGCEGHLLTNQHCIGTAAAAANTNYEFMAEGASCATNCAIQLGCAGTIEATSATLIQVNAPRDYALVKLPTNVSSTYGYLQLRPTGAVVNERIYIPQHPLGWGKQIAVFSTHAQDQSGFAEVFSLTQPACQAGGPQDVGYYADTQGGSSGSPVLAYSDHRVVALHHCANCPNRGVPIQSVISHLGANLPACAISVCGNGVIEPGEVCDGNNLGGATCLSLGFDGGTLACNACTALDTSGCFNCDGGKGNGTWNLPVLTGVSPGFATGPLYDTNSVFAYTLNADLFADPSGTQGRITGTLSDGVAPDPDWGVNGGWRITNPPGGGEFSAKIYDLATNTAVGELKGEFRDNPSAAILGAFELYWQICQ